MTYEHQKQKVKSTWRILLNYFLRGLLVLLPFAITLGIIIWIINGINNVLIEHELGPKLVAFSAIGILAFILATGYFTKGVVAQQVLGFFEGIIEKAPGLKFIFGTTKDMTEAFVGDKKKFTKPAIVEISSGVFKMGFITQKNMSIIGKPDHIAVYLPFCYAISGEMLIVEKEKVTPVDHESSHVTKFIISGGVANLEKENNV